MQRPPSLANRAARPRTTIGLTPLIDVVFILLVFFMLASKFVDWRAIEIDAPVRSGGGGGMEGAVLLQIREGDLRLSGVALSLDELRARLREQHGQNLEQRVLIQPAPGVSLQRAVMVLEQVVEAGLTNVSFSHRPEK